MRELLFKKGRKTFVYSSCLYYFIIIFLCTLYFKRKKLFFEIHRKHVHTARKNSYQCEILRKFIRKFSVAGWLRESEKKMFMRTHSMQLRQSQRWIFVYVCASNVCKFIFLNEMKNLNRKISHAKKRFQWKKNVLIFFTEDVWWWKKKLMIEWRLIRHIYYFKVLACKHSFLQVVIVKKKRCYSMYEDWIKYVLCEVKRHYKNTFRKKYSRANCFREEW